jgi:2,4'-dihydroxyacetophenone dioxygenase
MTVDPHARVQTGPEVNAGDVHDPHALDDAVAKYARTDVMVPPGDEASPWVPFVENVYIRHLSFDVRSNTYVNVLRVDNGGRLGRHRHRGPVSGVCLEGSWRYLEYDWTAEPGGYVHEYPGAIHTLVCDNPSGMKTLFWMNGSFEFYDDNDNITDILDVFWFINHYVSYCEQNGLPVNERMFL